MEGYRYPKRTEIRKYVDQIVEHAITDTASDLTRNAIQKLSALMDELYPYALIYQAHIDELKLNHNTLIEQLPGYAPLPKKLQDKYLDGLKASHAEAKAEMSEMVSLLKQFAKNINGWDEEHFGKLMQVKEEMNL